MSPLTATTEEILAERIIAFANNALRNTKPDAPDHWISDREGFRAAKKGLSALFQMAYESFPARELWNTLEMIRAPLGYWEWMDEEASHRTGRTLAILERALTQATRHARILKDILTENRTNIRAETGENRGNS